MEENWNDEYKDPDTISAFSRVCIAGNEKSYILLNNVTKYYDKLKSALDDIKIDIKCNYLHFSFIALASATLEFSLNFLYTQYFFDKYGGEEYKRYARIYQSLNFKNKLFTLPQIILGSDYVLNENDANVKNLYELISLRNNILHNSEDVQEIVFPDLGAQIVDDNVFIPLKNTNNGIVEFTINTKDNIIETLTPERCIRLGDSLINFYSTFMVEYFRHTDVTNSTFVRKL